MKKKLHTVQVAAPEASAQLALPDEVVVSLAEIAGVAKEGLLDSIRPRRPLPFKPLDRQNRTAVEVPHRTGHPRGQPSSYPNGLPRLAHVGTVPITYLWRPYQVVVWNRRATR